VFKPLLTAYCPACQEQVSVKATEHRGLDGITTTRTTLHRCDGLAAAEKRGDKNVMQTLLHSAQ
jgi:hypothetical protein